MRKPSAHLLVSVITAMVVRADGEEAGMNLKALSFQVGEARGIGRQAGVCRRDPSDVIKVGDTFYVWYSKVKALSKGRVSGNSW